MQLFMSPKSGTDLTFTVMVTFHCILNQKQTNFIKEIQTRYILQVSIFKECRINKAATKVKVCYHVLFVYLFCERL